MFDYDLHLSFFGANKDRAMICCHGYGDNYEIALSLYNIGCIQATLVGFNFPEYDIKQGRLYNPTSSSFGTINEILPPLYAIKQTLSQGFKIIDLYGFSAGGGAVINLLYVLNTTKYDSDLEKIGIHPPLKKDILSALEKGIVILDTPLKSVEEILAYRGPSEELEALSSHYRENDLRPIDSILKIKGLCVKILLHFQKADEVLSNRDDKLYIERLQQVLPKENLTIILGDDGGHMAFHKSLWDEYSKIIP